MPIDVRENIRTVAAVWRDARSGSLVGAVEGEAGPVRIELHEGGLCTASEVSVLARAIARTTLRFEPGNRSGPGDRRVMGRLLLGVGRAVAQRTGGTIAQELVVQLVLPTGRIAGVLDAELVERLSARPVEVGELLRDGSVSMTELRALAWIGVIRTARPRTPRAHNPELQAVCREGQAPTGSRPPRVEVARSTAALGEVAAFGIDQAIEELPACLRGSAPDAVASIGEEALLSGVEEEFTDDLSPAEVERLLARGTRLDGPFSRPAPPPALRGALGRGYAADACLDGFELGPVVGALVARSRREEKRRARAG